MNPPCESKLSLFKDTEVQQGLSWNAGIWGTHAHCFFFVYLYQKLVWSHGSLHTQSQRSAQAHASIDLGYMTFKSSGMTWLPQKVVSKEQKCCNEKNYVGTYALTFHSGKFQEFQGGYQLYIIYCTYVYTSSTHTTYWMFEPKKNQHQHLPQPQTAFFGAEL